MKFPETLSDIPLERYQKFAAIEEPTNADLVKCLLGITDAQLARFKTKEVDTLVVHFNEMFEEKNTPFKMHFTFDGIEYGFIPQLDDITYGENQDLTKYINDYSTMHKAMAVAYRPVTFKRKDRYLIEDYQGSHKYSEVMKKAPLDVVMGMMVFFWNLTKELSKVTLNYSLKQAKELASLEKNGELTENFTPSHKEILDGLMKSQN